MRRPTSFLLPALAAALLAPSVALADDEVPDSIRKALADRDADGDGVLSPTELVLHESLYAIIDQDGSGAVDAAELHGMAKLERIIGRYRRPDLEERFRQADKDGDGVIAKGEYMGPEMAWERLDRDGDGKLTYDEAAAARVEQDIAKVFEGQDGDLSGTLTEDEVTPEGKAAFGLFDADADGEVSGEEVYRILYAAALEGRRRRELEGGGAPPGPGVAPSPGARADVPRNGPTAQALLAVLEQRDADGDGAFSPSEFPGSRSLFARMDLDDDGLVDPAEIRVRERLGKDLAARGERIRALAVGLGDAAAGELSIYQRELEGLSAAGRLEEIAELLTEIELRIERLRS